MSVAVFNIAAARGHPVRPKVMVCSTLTVKKHTQPKLGNNLESQLLVKPPGCSSK